MSYKFLKLTIPYDNQHGPLVMEQILSALHSFDQKFSWEIWRINGSIQFGIWTKNVSVITKLLEMHYPGILIYEDTDITSSISKGQISYLHLLSCDIFPIRRYAQTNDLLNRYRTDPYLGILASLPKQNNTGIQIIFKPIFWHKKARDTMAINDFIGTGWIFSRFWKIKSIFLKSIYRCWILRILFVMLAHGRKKLTFDTIDQIDHRGHNRESASQAARSKLSQIGFEVTIRFIDSGNKEQNGLQTMASGFSQFSIPEFNGFKMGKVYSYNNKVYKMIQNRDLLEPFVLSLEELAGVLALPTKEIKIPELARTSFRTIKRENSPQEQGIVLGKSMDNQDICLSSENFTKHIAIFGKTGSGKSTFAFNMLFELMQQGAGMVIVDPHGDLVDTCIAHIPLHRKNDVVVIDPTDTEYPVAINPLCGADKTRIVSTVVSIFQKLYLQNWGPRTDYILTNVIALLVEQEQSSLLDVQRVLLDGNYRKQCILNTSDPMIRQFWEKEFLRIPARMRNEAIVPILNKVNRFLMIPMIRNILGQKESKIDFRKCIDEHKIVLVKLSKGQMGEENSALLGNFILALIQIAVLSRADVKKNNRSVFHLFIDELQHFTSLTNNHIATLLTEGRKYGINLILATQHTSQLAELENNIFGNVNTLVSFSLGHVDAQKVSLYLGEVTTGDLMNVSPYCGYLKTYTKGIAEVVSFKNIEPCDISTSRDMEEKILKLSRTRYARPREEVETEIRESFSNSDIPLP